MDNSYDYNGSFASHIELIERTRDLLAGTIHQVAKLLANSLSQGGTLFWCGNGGSAADSQHLAAELVGRFSRDRRALRSVALTTDSSVLTCVANDYCFDDVFSRQIEALGRPGDILIAISTSGNSENILRAIRAARTKSLVTVALLGRDGGAARACANHVLVVPSDSTARIQETHILIGHILCEAIEKELDLA